MSLDYTLYQNRMDTALDGLKRELAGIRAGRASASMLDTLKVESYGSFVPLSQVGNVTAPEPRMLLVKLWDNAMVKPVEKAIRESSLGVNPSIDGQTVRVTLPELNEERRTELTKVVAKYAEEGRIAVRNVRRDGIEQFRKMEKAKEISQDDLKRAEEKMQKMTDEYVKKVDDMLASKQKDIMQV